MNGDDSAKGARTTEKAGEVTSIGMELIGRVPVMLEARLGQAVMTVESLLGLKSGALVTLETSLADHAELYLDGALVARGDIVAVGDNYAIRVVEVAPET